jgi:tRNA threonylcarbamoyl adenosine modification protein YjeE
MSARAMTLPTDSFFQQFDLASEAETAALGRRIAKLLRVGDTITLAGTLGAGKTVLARALVRHFLPGEEVPSPTFTLVQTYETPALAISHIDLYRVKARSEVRELGLDEALERGALLIEWPDRMGELLPVDRLDVVFEGVEDDETRILKLIGRGSWAPRVKDLSR